MFIHHLWLCGEQIIQTLKKINYQENEKEIEWKIHVLSITYLFQRPFISSIDILTNKQNSFGCFREKSQF